MRLTSGAVFGRCKARSPPDASITSGAISLTWSSPCGKPAHQSQQALQQAVQQCLMLPQFTTLRVYGRYCADVTLCTLHSHHSGTTAGQVTQSPSD